MVKTYQDFYDFLKNETAKLSYAQAKVLVEFYVQDFIKNLPKDFYQHQSDAQIIHFEKIVEMIKQDFHNWDLTAISHQIAKLDKINQVEQEDWDSTCIDLCNLLEAYEKFITKKGDLHQHTYVILENYFFFLECESGIDFYAENWEIDPEIKPHINKLKEFFMPNNIWDSYFLSNERVSDDFMADRCQMPQSERESFD